MTTTALGTPLAVYSALTYCDGKGEHEARLITDGTRAVAYTTAVGYDLTVARTGPVLSTLCPVPDPHTGDDCPGALSWSLEDPDTWTADPEPIAVLTEHGEAVER